MASIAFMGSCGRYNQNDSLVRPLKKWLDQRGVVFQIGTIVTGLSNSDHDGQKAVTLITCETQGKANQIEVGPNDYVLVTLGSMTDGSSLGGMDEVPTLNGKEAAAAWKLWERLAVSRPEFGRPAVFANHVDQSKWISFTVTLHKPTLLDLIRDATGNVPGEGGLITFPKSNWLASIVIPHQPHFIGQPENVAVFWGYALTVDAPGNFVHKPMSACTGREILTEILGHLDLAAQSPDILRSANCIPCMMPFITSQFLKRQTGDRPDIFPEGWRNLALIGQFVEMPDDVVFTVEYSIRAAQTAAYELLGLKRKPPQVYKGVFDPRVLYRSFMALHDRGG
jgi:oleate hydratase